MPPEKGLCGWAAGLCSELAGGADVVKASNTLKNASVLAICCMWLPGVGWAFSELKNSWKVCEIVRFFLSFLKLTEYLVYILRLNK